MATDLTQTVPPKLEDRFKLVLEMATESDMLSDAMKAELKALLAPENLAMIVGVLVVWAGSHAFGVGLIFDAIMIGASIFMVGWSAWEAAKKIAEFMEKTIRARNMNDLKIASTLLAAAIAILSVKLFMRLISKGAAGATNPGKTGRSTIHAKVEEAPKAGPKSGSGGGSAKKAPPVTPKQAAAAKKHGVDPKWVDADGQIKWPPNNGFDGPPTSGTMKSGSTISRYGGYQDELGNFKDTGKFVAPADTPFAQRALPSSSANNPYKEYVVVKDIPGVQTGKSAAWFDQPGGGTQNLLPKSIDDLLREGYIREVP